MGKFKNYINKKIAMLSLAMANVEKNALSQGGGSLEKETNHEVSVNQGTLLQALIRGEVTKEVQELRWRMYKIDSANQKIRTKIIGKDENGNNIVETYEYDENKALEAITSDLNDYKLIMVFDNQPILKTFDDSTNIEIKDFTDEIRKNYVVAGGGNLEITEDDENKKLKQNLYDASSRAVSAHLEKYGEAKPVEKNDDIKPVGGGDESKPIGIISLNSANVSTEVTYPLIIDRDGMHTHDIETFTEKVYIRQINDEEFLLELLIQEKPNPSRENSKAFVNLLSKAKDNIAFGDVLNIKKLMFVTSRTLGAKNNLLFEYDDLKFVSISIYNGFYHVKYEAKILTNGKNLLENFIDSDLEEKYKNKEKK